jgi:riboflavin synthase
MFTGLVEGKGKIVFIEKGRHRTKFKVSPYFPLDDLKIGDSIAINGACLTVINIIGDAFEVELSLETLTRTTFQNIQIGKEVNLERALHLRDRLGGHLVLGHIDTITTLRYKEQKGEHIRLSFNISKEWGHYIVEKGSIAIDGVSLTVNRHFLDNFEVNIIPHTAKATTLGKLKIGEKVNIETDLIGKYVVKLLSPWKKEGLGEDFLKEHGFYNE